MPASQELTQLLQKRDPGALKLFFELYFSKLSAIALRYAKNETQADALLHNGLTHCYNSLLLQRNLKQLDFDVFIENEFILSSIQFLKSIRNEYYVSSTVHATENAVVNYNLFDNNDWVDLNQVGTEILIQSIQQLVPSQRLVFNLHVIEGKNLNDVANLIESSAETVKSNLEKARYYLQKNLEKNFKK